MLNFKYHYLGTIALGMAIGFLLGGLIFRNVPIFISIRLQEIGLARASKSDQTSTGPSNTHQLDPKGDKRRNQEWIDAHRKDPLALLTLLDANGEVSSAALTLAGMPPWSSVKVKRIYDAVLDSTKKEMSGRIQRDDERTDERKGVFTYQIKGDPDKSSASIATIESRLTSEFGVKSALVLMKGMSHGMPLGDFGKHDLDVTINKNEPPESSKYIVVEVFDANTGFKYTKQNCSIDKFRAKYGDMFDFALAP